MLRHFNLLPSPDTNRLITPPRLSQKTPKVHDGSPYPFLTFFFSPETRRKPIDVMFLLYTAGFIPSLACFTLFSPPHTYFYGFANPLLRDRSRLLSDCWKSNSGTTAATHSTSSQPFCLPASSRNATLTQPSTRRVANLRFRSPSSTPSSRSRKSASRTLP